RRRHGRRPVERLDSARDDVRRVAAGEVARSPHRMAPDGPRCYHGRTSFGRRPCHEGRRDHAMSPNPTAEQPQVNNSDDPDPLTPPTELCAEEKRRRVAEWRRVLAGEIDKPMPPPPPRVVWSVEMTYRDWERKGIASEKARLDLLDFLTLHYY